VPWSVGFCSCIECEVQKTWMSWMVVVGGIYSLQPLFQSLLSMGTLDSPMVHWIWYYSLSGACHVSIPFGFGAVDHWSHLSFYSTWQSGVFWLLSFDFWRLHCVLFTVHSNRPLGVVWPLLHWLTGHVWCTPDSPMNYSGVTLEKSRERLVRGCFGLGTGRCPVRHWQHQCLSLL
jgi:hypothetical protein